MLLQRRQQQRIVQILKSGVRCDLILNMDDRTFTRHLRLNNCQFERFIRFLEERGHGNDHQMEQGSRPRIDIERKALMFLWYMANTNSFREISDKFNVSQSSSHRVIAKILLDISHFSRQQIRWPNDNKKRQSADKFLRISAGIENIVGAIDGCHIRINRPPRRGDDYMNRKGYYSVLLQGVCDEDAKFLDVFVGPPGRIHDARLLRCSPLFERRADLFDNQWKLLGDSAYVCRDFDFIVAPIRNNGNLTREDERGNTNLSRARVIIENAFGRLKCRFRRVKEVLNVNLDIVVRVIIAACSLHNMLTADNMDCAEHPDGCPREDDNND